MKSFRSRLVLFCCALLVVAGAAAYAQSTASPDACVGVWKTGNGKGMVQIYQKGDRYFGRLVWLKEPNDPKTGQPKLDKNNDDETKRTRPIMGLVMLRNFSWDADDAEWNDGYIYDPENGEEYSCTMKLKDANTLDVRGYVMVSAFGRTDTWKRQVKK